MQRLMKTKPSAAKCIQLKRENFSLLALSRQVYAEGFKNGQDALWKKTLDEGIAEINRRVSSSRQWWKVGDGDKHGATGVNGGAA